MVEAVPEEYKLTFEEARAYVAKWDSLTDEEFEQQRKSWFSYKSENKFPPQIDFKKRRRRGRHSAGYDNADDELNQIFREFDSGDGSIKGERRQYELDVKIGLALYSMFPALEDARSDSGLYLAPLQAADDDMWRYWSVIVYPHLTYMRYPTPGKGDIRINRKRFYAHTRRIWLKTLWWYVYLSWQGSVDATQKVLASISTDGISQLVERVGKGYRLDCLREIMRQYSELPDVLRSSDSFKHLMRLNTAKAQLVEPELVEGGVAEYAHSLIQESICRNNGR